METLEIKMDENPRLLLHAIRTLPVPFYPESISFSAKGLAIERFPIDAYLESCKEGDIKPYTGCGTELIPSHPRKIMP